MSSAGPITPEFSVEDFLQFDESEVDESEVNVSEESEESFEIDVEAPLNGTTDYIGILACAIEVGQNVTTEFGLATIWESFEPLLLVHLANVTDCPNAGDADAIQVCFDRESEAALVTYSEFLDRVREVSERCL